MHRCARCRRPMLSKPVFVNSLGYGPTCALKVQDQMPLRPKRARMVSAAPRRKDVRQVSFLEVA